MSAATPRLAITPGEPAGIGPDLVLRILASDWPAELVVTGDPAFLRERAARLGVRLEASAYDPGDAPRPHRAGELKLAPVPLANTVTPGRLDPGNAAGVIETLRRACGGCLSGEFDGMVTAPVQKSVINDAGIAFSGHTEFLADQCGCPLPVMLLVAGSLRVALVTTHLPLRAVPDAITGERIAGVTRVLNAGLGELWGLPAPRIAVLGLNPHAGEGGHLGTEERDVIAPALDALRAEGLAVSGPLPADTAFTPAQLQHYDAVLAMYHDQGLPVLKHHGFGHGVNVTLGLGILRTSVDHGTALELAGTGQADDGSLRAALTLAIEAASRRPGA